MFTPESQRRYASLKASTPQRRYASLKEAAAYLDLTVTTLRRHIAAGEITAYRFGPRTVRVDLDEIDAAMRPIPTAKAE